MNSESVSDSKEINIMLILAYICMILALVSIFNTDIANNILRALNILCNS